MTLPSLPSRNNVPTLGRPIPFQTEKFKIDYVTFNVTDICDRKTYFDFLILELKTFGIALSRRNAKCPINYDIAKQLVVRDRHFVEHTCGKLAYSSKYQRVILELTGLACDYIYKSRNDYRWLSSMSSQPNITISRCDIAFDDISGYSSITKLDKAYSRGRFNPFSGKRPEKTNVGDTQKGRTRYIGGKTAYKSLCAYEKGKQLKRNELQDWIRFEVRFRSNTRDTIPASIIADREAFFINAFPRFFTRLCGSADSISIVERRAIEYQSSLKRKLETGRHFSGRLVNVLRHQLSDQEVVEQLIRPGVPKGLLLPGFVSDQDLSDTNDLITDTEELS